MPPSISAPAKHALLIGIDKYPKLTQLEGCVNDVTLMGKILRETFGFPAENVTLLANGEATRDAILAAMDALVTATGRDDIVVMHYAGHGSQMTDREGDEPDGMDETIMPFDSEGRWGVNRDITDDEIHLRLLELGKKTSFTTLIFDSCHSGTITRDAFGMKSRSIEPDTRPIKDLPPSPIPRELWRGARDSGPSGWMPLTDKYVLLAGCRDEETSFEYRPPEAGGKVVHGALTYFLSEELRKAKPGTSYRDVFESAAAKVNAANSNQHPQMEGRADREIFGVSDLEPMQFVGIVSRSENGVSLAAGAAHGMSVGSTWAIYPEGTKRTDGAERLGEVEITGVRAVVSEARITNEKSSGAIAEGTRAVETTHSYGELRLAVQLTGAAGSDPALVTLRQEVKSSPLLKIVGEAEPAAVRIYLLAPRAQATAGDAVPTVGRIDAPTWAGVGENGELIMPLKRLGAEFEVRQNLEKVARYRQALALDNPDPMSALRGKVSLEVLRRAADGTWLVAKPEAAGGQVVFEEGEPIAFRVTSRHHAPVFVNLLDFGLTGAVQLVYPATGAGEKLTPGGSFEFGTRPTDKLTLQMPKEFPYANAPIHAPIEGTETLKLILTQSQTDFRFLTQAGMRSGTFPRAGSPLALLWQTAAGAAAMRDIHVSVPLGEEDWAAVATTFVLRRRTSVPLASNESPIQLDDVSVQAVGISGEMQLHPGKSGRAEAEELTRNELTRALDEAGVVVRQTLAITGTREAKTRAVGPRHEPTLEVRVRDPGPDYGQMLLTTDELGVISWRFAPVAEIEPARTRGKAGATPIRTYRVPAAVPALQTRGAASRGLVGAVGRKFLKVLVFPLVEPGIGAISDSFANSWEQKHRPYRLRAFGPDDYNSPDAGEIDAAGWKRLGAGRALLMVHGTFSRAHTAFGAMPKDFMESLYQWYSGRVFAFDHFTLSHDPRRNVDWFLGELPEGTSLDLDIICHSRGGLVSRMLSEKQNELVMGSRTVRIGRVVFVGAPNAGTILADADHVGDFIDSYTNLLNFVPDSGVSDILAGIITVAKQLAVGAVKGLPGLQSMRPGGEFGAWLNAGGRAGETRYFALASDFTPGEPGLKEFAADRIMDKVFQKKANDLVVPTTGVFSANGSAFFPIEQKVVFEGSQSVAHTAYFGSRGVREKIAEWLGA
ncbi:MAG TPA: caspase family protein [Gemmatimonadales bacterium]|jgi:hypothetical protein